MNHDYPWTYGYITQYLDILNIRFIDMGKEKRLKSIPTLPKRLTEQNKVYLQIKEVVLDGARENGCPKENIRLIGQDSPEEIDW